MASQNPFPLMPPISTELRLSHFDEQIYRGTSDTLLYKYVDAICGTTGVGALLNEAFLARLSTALETIYFNDLDYIFGKIRFLSRSPAESYTYNPMKEMLTSDQWSEVKVKDTWYRERIRNFFIGASLGGTPEGVKMIVQAALGVDCTILESWRYIDNFGLTTTLGRANARNEITIRPKGKAYLLPEEWRLVRGMLDKVCPVDTIVTININGLSDLTPVRISAAASNSTYYEVVKSIRATPVIKTITSAEDLNLTSSDLNSSHFWLFDATTEAQEAPYAAFNITSEYGFYYLIGGGERSPIDSVTYGTLKADGEVTTESNFEVHQNNGAFTDWYSYELADCAQNFPGGKFGLTPTKAPALNPDRTPYKFPWASQLAFIEEKINEILKLGGVADAIRYRLPLTASLSPKTTYLPEYAVAYSAPSQESTVSTGITTRRPTTLSTDWADTSAYVSR
jgi:hypothetical protein